MATRISFALIEADGPDWDDVWGKWFGPNAEEE